LITFSGLMYDVGTNLGAALVGAILGIAITFVMGRTRDRSLRKRLRRLEAHHHDQGTEVVLVVSCRHPMDAEVSRFLRAQGVEVAESYRLHHPGLFGLDEKEWDDFIAHVAKLAGDIRTFGATRVHFFTNVPLVAGVMAGALLDNGPETWLYHHDSKAGYVHVGTLAFGSPL